MKRGMFYLEEVHTPVGVVMWQIRKRDDASVWAQVYDKVLAELTLKQANKMI